MSSNVPEVGTGNYHHEESKDGWGKIGIQIVSKYRILVDQEYQAKNTIFYPAYVWKKVSDNTK